MQICRNCGAQMGDQDRFCMSCGTPAQAPAPAPVTSAPIMQQPQNNQPIQAYIGVEQNFTLMGRNFAVSAGMDTFNFYRKAFRDFARFQARMLEAEYRARINDLDSFFIDFPEMYAKYRQPLLDCAMGIILQTDAVMQFPFDSPAIRWAFLKSSANLSAPDV